MKIVKTKQTISRILATQELRTTKKICSIQQPLLFKFGVSYQKFTAQNWECLRKADYTWAKEKMEIGQLDSMVQICNKNRVNIKEQAVDNNGNSTDIGIQGLIIKPNPSTGLFSIEFKAASEKAKVTIYNSIGQVVYLKILNVIPNESRIINLDFQTTLSAGMYHCILENGNKKSSSKIIIQK